MTGHLNVGSVLLDILVVLIAAKVAAELAERVSVPAVVGEILAGVIVGPSMLGLVAGNDVLRVLGELGVILLLLEVGLQMDLGDLRAVGRASLSVATVGVILPFAGGYVVALAFNEHGHTALFVAAALTATSVGVTARVFSDLRALASVEARTVLGAAVADDVMGLVILTIVVRIADRGSVSLLAVTGIVLLAIGFLVVTTGLGVRLAPSLFALVDRLARSTGTMVAIALAFTLAFAKLASAVKLAPIVGAFVAGLALARSREADRIRRELTPVGHLFIPVFFLQIGIDVRIRELAHPSVLGLAAALLAVAVIGKIGSAAAAVGSPGDKVLIGLGMLPRGEVGLIFATIGLRSGVLSPSLYAALLLVILATTIITPPVLRWRLVRLSARRRAAANVTVAPPPGGWLEVGPQMVDLRGQPPPRLALPLALEVAVLLRDARPGPKLLDWLGSLGDEPVTWDATATKQLLRVLREGNARSWRFLDTTGILERALPELAAAFQRRRADPFELDPTHALRWALVERLEKVTTRDPIASAQANRLQHPDWLLLAAVILEAAGDHAPPVQLARQLVKRLDLGAAAEEVIALLVHDHALLRAAARRNDGLNEDSVLQIAAHLGNPERARALYVLSVALGDLESWDRQRLDELHDLVQQALAHPELTSLEARNLAERRRAEAVRIVGETSPAAERVRGAPLRYLLLQDATETARQAELLEPLPDRREVRARVRKLDSGQWRIDVASRDQWGLLARVTGVLSNEGFNVLEAIVATWPDGGALEAFRVTGTSEPDATALEAAIPATFMAPLEAPGVPDATVRFDNEASPWYTICDVEARDRPGLLHSLAAAFAVAGTSVHSARVETVDGKAKDRFELTDHSLLKLDGERKAAVGAAITSGVKARRRRLRANTIATRGTHTFVTNLKHLANNHETAAP